MNRLQSLQRSSHALHRKRYRCQADHSPRNRQREPVFIERDQKEVAVILSARDYDRISGKASRAFNDFCDAVAERATARGLTEEILSLNAE